jgi:hypothetical protein
MVVLLVTLIYWTRGAEAALGDGTLAEYEQACTAGLMDVVAMVRGELTALQRATLGALVVTDVHARDVVAELVKQRVDSAAAFSWQVRHQTLRIKTLLRLSLTVLVCRWSGCKVLMRCLWHFSPSYYTFIVNPQSVN